MFDAYRRPAWHAHYFEQESIKENLRILAAAHTDPYVLEQAYAQDEENEPMMQVGDRVTSPQLRLCGVDVGIIASTYPDGSYWVRNEGNSVGMMLFDRDMSLAPPIDPTGDPLDDDEIADGEDAPF